MSITFITGHAKKAEQLSRHLDYEVDHYKLDLKEIQTLDPVEVTIHKAKEAYAMLKKPVLVEDVSIRFEALGRLPGTLIKWFLEELKVEGLCKLLNGYQTRKAIVAPYFGLCVDGEKVEIFTAEITGEITKEPRGENGFGLDSIFIPDGYTKTWGQMNDEEQNETSVRKLALKKLHAYLQENKI